MAAQDPTAQKAAQKGEDLTTQQKVEGAMSLIDEIGTGMLTSQSPDGRLASRAMIAASTEGIQLSYFFNLESGKTDDIEARPDVNVAYVNPKTGDWVSVSGRAHINRDRAKVKKYWSSKLKAWFDDKKDGIHKGDSDDPRVAFLEVEPVEIRYFESHGKLKQFVETAKAAVSSQAAAGGKLIIIDQSEIALARQMHGKPA